MTADTAVPAAPITPDATADRQQRDRRTVARLVVRWVFLAGATGLAFHRTILTLVDSTRAGSLNGFVWLMPIAAIVAAIGVSRRDRTELPIHDRQTDIIVGVLGLVFALMLQTVLLERYAEYFYLLRIDLIAMWFFVSSSSVVLFGLRPVIRFAWVWVLLLMTFPAAYQLGVILLGGNRASAGLAELVVAAAATAVAVGRNRGRAALGALGALLVGMAVLTAIAVLTPNAPVFVFQMVPASVAMILVGMGLYFYARRGQTKRLLDRKIEPLAARQVWAGAALVSVVAVALSLASLPAPALPPTSVPGMTFGRPLVAPAGWHETEQSDYRWVKRIYGRDANLIRQEFVADTGNPEWDKFARPRTVMVDSISTENPFSLKSYPATVLYDQGRSRISDPTLIDLGGGVTGSAVTVVDDVRLLTYNVLTWTWRNGSAAQRVTVAAVDDHEAEVVYPEPDGGLGPTLRTMVAVFFRGNQATWDSDPTFKDLDMLTEFGRGLVHAQLRQVDERS